jgi:CelD/BcsL family acetyltransferase involved in cellulose biosynthesis
MQKWWQTRGGGEWHKGNLTLILAYEDNQIIGIAPFFESEYRGKQSLLFVGSFNISDYLDFIVKPAHLQDFLSGLLNFLIMKEGTSWQSIVLYNLLEHSPTIPLLEKLTKHLNISLQVEVLEPAPYIPLPSNWETYLADLNKKRRHEIRRKIRRAEENAQLLRWYIVQDHCSLETEIEAFLTLMAQDKTKSTFLTDLMRDQMNNILKWALNKDILQLSFLEINGEKAAGYFCFDYHNRIWVYNSGFDNRFREFSPGWVLLIYLIQWAIENGREVFDLMRGGEAYKYRFGAIDRQVVKVTINR